MQTAEAPPRTLERGTYLGGHDAARIVGVHQYGAGVADVYANIVNKQKTEQNPRMLRGLLMEPGLIEWVKEKRGRELIGKPMARGAFAVHKEIPFIAGSLDAVEVGWRVMHEVTTTTTTSRHIWGVPGTDDCSKLKWVQCQHYMSLVPTLVEAHVWCFVVDGDEEPLHYVVPRNEVAIAELQERCEAFWWDHIVPKIPPMPGAGAIYSDENEAMQKLFPRATGDVIDADSELVSNAMAYATYRAAEKMAKEGKELHGAKIKAVLTEHEGARWDGGSVSWKETSLGEKTVWEQVAHEVALKAGMQGETFNGIVRENTFKSFAKRALRVNVKGLK